MIVSANRSGIDMHNHWLSKKYLELIRDEKIESLAKVVNVEMADKLQFIDPHTDRKIIIPLKPELTERSLREKDFIQQRINKVVVSHVPFTSHYRHDAQLVKIIHETINDDLALMVSKDKEHLRGLANVPMQDINLAIEELERVVTKLGLSGVQIGTNVCGKYLGDKSFLPFFEAAAHLGAFVLLHPLDVAGGDRLTQFYFRNLIGNPLDTTISAGSIVFGGVFDHFPEVKIGLCHAGGQMPYLFGRWDHGYKVRNECKHLPKAPSAYLKNFYYDIITHSEKVLQYLISVVGPDRVMLGTDYPFDMGVEYPMDVLERVSLSDEAIQKISWENADSIFFHD